jgi:hypothetical protein
MHILLRSAQPGDDVVLHADWAAAAPSLPPSTPHPSPTPGTTAPSLRGSSKVLASSQPPNTPNMVPFPAGWSRNRVPCPLCPSRTPPPIPVPLLNAHDTMGNNRMPQHRGIPNAKLIPTSSTPPVIFSKTIPYLRRATKREHIVAGTKNTRSSQGAAAMTTSQRPV